MFRSKSSPLQSSRDQAIAWHARLDGEAAEADWQDFTLWLEADTAHRLAFDEVADFSAEIAAQAPSLEKLERAPRGDMPMPRVELRRLWAGAAALAAAGVFLFVTQPWLSKPLVQAMTIATTVGERREVLLEDGSTLDINTDTTLSYALREDGREVHLEKGEVFFNVAPDRARPFVVVMGDQRVRVVGTSFNALRHTQRVSVAVNQGVVQVLRGGDSLTAITLSVGEQYLGREKSPEYRVLRVNPDEVSSWREGRLIFQDTPLGEVAEELSRYFARPVVIQDTTLGNLRFSGILRIDQENEMLRRLAAFLPISIHENNGTVILQRGSAK
jgi:transmembrane sensor